MSKRHNTPVAAIPIPTPAKTTPINIGRRKGVSVSRHQAET